MEPTTDRGASSVVGVVLLVGMVAAGSIGLVVVGGSLLDEERDRTEVEQAEQSFQVLDHDIDTVARGELGTARTTDFDLSGTDSAVRKRDAGRIVVKTSQKGELINRTFGSIEYERGDTVIAYQNGGVWRTDGNETRMLSAPGLSYEVTQHGTNPTLTVPITELSGDETIVSGDITARKTGTSELLDNTSVVENELVVVEVQSEYYQGWAAHFRNVATPDAVSVDHENRTASVRLLSPAEKARISGGVVSGGAGSELNIKQDNTIDSYNSTQAPYVDGSNDARVVLGGDLTMKQNSRIEGDVVVGQDADFKQDATVTGDLSYGNTVTPSTPDEHVDGEVTNDASVTAHTAVDHIIDEKRAALSDPANNSNDDADDVVDGRLGDCSPSCTLDSGSYVLDDLTLDSDDELVLNTTGGDIDIVVNDSVELQGGDSSQQATIRVTDASGRVNVYVDGEHGDNLAFKGHANVSVPGDRSTSLWFYLNPESTTSFKHNVTFTGVVYGPGPGADPGTTITMQQHSQVYGALVGEVDQLKQGSKIHYDEALAAAKPIEKDTAVPRLTFLHVTVREVEIENG